jgi:hypothetical protein
MRASGDQQVQNSNRAKAATKISTSNHQPPPSTTAPKRPLPRASLEKAQKIFKNFSLSKFSKQPLPANRVAEGKSKDPSAVHAVQKKLISQNIKTLNNGGEPTQGMTLALTAEQIKTLLPSYRDKAGTVELSDVLSLLTKKMSGTEFYANGNPTLNRLKLQSQVDQIIQSIKQEPKR